MKIDYNVENACTGCKLKFPKTYKYCTNCRRQLRTRANRSRKNKRDRDYAKKKQKTINQMTKINYGELVAQ